MFDLYLNWPQELSGFLNDLSSWTKDAKVADAELIGLKIDQKKSTAESKSAATRPPPRGRVDSTIYDSQDLKNKASAAKVRA